MEYPPDLIVGCSSARSYHIDVGRAAATKGNFQGASGSEDARMPLGGLLFHRHHHDVSLRSIRYGDQTPEVQSGLRRGRTAFLVSQLATTFVADSAAFYGPAVSS